MSKSKKKDYGLLPTEKPHRLSLFGWLRGRFFAGMFIALPVVVTFLILQVLISEIDKRVVPLLPAALKPETWGGSPRTSLAARSSVSQTAF